MAQLHRGLRSSEALQLIPRWRTEPWGCWPSAALLPQITCRLFCAAAIPQMAPRATLPPPLPPKVGADDSPPDMCVIWASLPGQLVGYFWSWSSPDLVSAGVSPCPAPCSHPRCGWGRGAPAAFVPTGLLRCSPVQGWVGISLGWLGTGGPWPGLRGLTWVYLLGKPNLRASLGGEGTGRSSWCRGRARKSKPAPRHVRPPLARRLGGWQPPSLSSWPPARSGKPCGGVAGGLLGGSWAGFVHPRSGALSHGSGCCAKHPSPHHRVGVLMGGCSWGPAYLEGQQMANAIRKGFFPGYTQAADLLKPGWAPDGEGRAKVCGFAR